MPSMKQKISLSTYWLSHRHNDGYEMLKEVANLGFEYVELSHGISVNLVPGINKAIGEGIIKVSSVHNFCPLPPGVMGACPNLYQPSSRDHQERELWLKFTKDTIDFANSLEAPIMVAHMGSISFFWSDPIKKLLKIPRSDSKYQAHLKTVLKKVETKASIAMGYVYDLLEEIIPYAQEKGVSIGIENRDGIDELPFDSHSFTFIDNLIDSGVVGYWHDSGHAKVKEQYGCINHADHLRENAPYLLGFHLKDVTSDGRDNQTIGTGVVDFDMIAEYIQPHHPLIVEVSPSLTPDEIIDSREYLEQLAFRAQATH